MNDAVAHIIIPSGRKRGSETCGRFRAYIEGLTVNYGSNIALDRISFQFRCGELNAVIGPNGGGKSTLLKAILGQVEYSGNIRFEMAAGNGSRPRIGYVPQNVSIQQDSPVSVCDLMLLSSGYFRTWFHVPEKKRREMKDLLAIVSAEKLIDRKIGELSGGEMQRVLLASSLNPIPDILLFDEPVSGVDIKGLESFYEIICSLRKTYHMSIILVSHDIGTVALHADNFILLNRSLILKANPEKVLNDPDFISLMGTLPVDLSKKKGELHCTGEIA